MADNPQTEIEIADNSSPTLATSALQTTGNASIASIDSKTPALISGRVPVDGSGVTQPISAVSLPLPLGASTSALQTTGNTSLATIATNSGLPGRGREYTSYSPDTSSYPGVVSEVSLDYSDQTMIRGQVLTDEGSFRDNFSGSSLTRNLTGNMQWNNNSTGVGGTGSSLFTTEIKAGDYIKRSADAESAYTQVDYITDNNQLYLTQNYLGANGTTTGVVSNWKQFTGTGGSLSVSNSILSIASSTANGNLVGINRSGDYLPYNLSGKFSVSQRIANQVTTFGFQNNFTTPTIQAVFIFDGTTNTSVTCRSSCSSAAAETQETVVMVPVGDTSTNHVYSIDLTVTSVTFLIDGVVVAVHEDYIPGPYDNMEVNLLIKNNAVVTTTTVACDWVSFQNIDQVEVTNGFRSESFKIKPADAPRSYSATIVNLVPALLATDIFTITGSATKTVLIKNITISGTQTTAGSTNLLLVKRSTANSGGTSSAPTMVSHDSSDSAATAVVRAYTANPTLGTLVGALNAIKQYFPTLTGVPSVEEYYFGDAPFKKEIVLRGTSQVLAVNLNGATVAGGNLDISIEWTEE